MTQEQLEKITSEEELEKYKKTTEKKLKIKKFFFSVGLIISMGAVTIGAKEYETRRNEELARMGSQLIDDNSEENVIHATRVERNLQLIDCRIVGKTNNIDADGNKLPTTYYVNEVYEVLPTTNLETGEKEYVVPDGYVAGTITDPATGNIIHLAYHLTTMDPETYETLSSQLPEKEVTNTIGQTPINNATNNYLGPQISSEVVSRVTETDENMVPVVYEYVKETYQVNPTVNPETGETLYLAPSGYGLQQITDKDGNYIWVATITIKRKLATYSNTNEPVDTQEYVENTGNTVRAHQR